MKKRSQRPGLLEDLFGDVPVVDFNQIARDVMYKYVEQNWLDIASYAFQHFFVDGKGIVLLSDHGEPESYISAPDINDREVRRKANSYDPMTQVIVLYPVSQDAVFVETFSLLPTPQEAEQVLHLRKYSEDYVPRDLSELRSIRLEEVNRFEEIVDLGLEVVQALYGKIENQYRRDVLHLAIKFIGHAKSMYRLSQEPDLLVPRLGKRNPTIDLGSISSIARIAIETYLTMHEVFFEPKSDDDFEFFHARWYLSGIEEIRKRVPEKEYQQPAESVVEPLRKEHFERLQRTSRYKQKLQRVGKNKADKVIRDLIRRSKSQEEWQRIAQSANFPKSFFQLMHGALSGYVHSDGYTSLKLNALDESMIDFEIDFALYVIMSLVAKMVVDLSERYPEVSSVIASENDTYRFAKILEQKWGKAEL